MTQSAELHASELKPGDRRDELVATAALMRAGVVAMHHLGTVIDNVGSAVRLVQLSENDRLFVSPDSSQEIVGAVTPRDLARSRADVEAWLDTGYDIRSVLDPEYPEALHDIFNRPPLLFIRGAWPGEVTLRAIAVVGAREASAEGLRRTTRLTRELVQSGFTIVSGLAKGVDTAAHEAALASSGATSAVMGTGLEHLFPADNASLATRIVESGGALISQFFPHQPPARWTFPMRNVVMSGLCLATVVVEAAHTSGARLQARVALQHGRTVFLLSSLVAQHEWARKYVEEGAYGTRAIEIGSTQQIVDRLEGRVGGGMLSVA